MALQFAGKAAVIALQEASTVYLGWIGDLADGRGINWCLWKGDDFSFGSRVDGAMARTF